MNYYKNAGHKREGCEIEKATCIARIDFISDSDTLIIFKGCKIDFSYSDITHLYTIYTLTGYVLMNDYEFKIHFTYGNNT